MNRLLTTREAALALGVTPEVIWQWTARRWITPRAHSGPRWDWRDLAQARARQEAARADRIRERLCARLS